MRRSAAGVSAMASIAFIIRLSRTCCNCTGSPEVAGKSLAKLDSDAHPAADQFAVEQGERRIDQFVELDRLEACLALLQQAPQPLDDLAGPIVFVHDVLQARHGPPQGSANPRASRYSAVCAFEGWP